jgi:Zn-finger nucleic acid-binding protein
MGCPGGACGKDGLEQRMLLCGIIVAIFSVGLIWISGYHKTAYALMSVPVLIFFFGPQLSRGLDRVTNAVVKVWRTYARLPGKRYCPECAGALLPPQASHPVSGDGCPKCDGSWCDSRELLRWLAAYGTAESTWLTVPSEELAPPMLCPQCAVPLESGSLDRLQPLFARCAACGGHWISRMTWTWFELTPPAPKKTIVRVEARAQSPLPELIFQKDAAP